jgi:hypothetical protein
MVFKGVSLFLEFLDFFDFTPRSVFCLLIDAELLFAISEDPVFCPNFSSRKGEDGELELS